MSIQTRASGENAPEQLVLPLLDPEFDELEAYEDINKDMHDLLFVMLDKNKMRLKTSMTLESLIV